MAEWGALLRRCPGSPDRGFKSLPLRQRSTHALVAVSIVFATLLVSVGAVSASACTKYHGARANDSWTRISARFGLAVSDLLALNASTTTTPIFVGDQICISNQPVITPPTERYTRKQVIAIIREVWPDDLEETAIFVARRESNLVPSVVGGRGNCCLGLFQIYWSVHKSWLAGAGITEPSQLLDPRTNAEAAMKLYRRNGSSWRPWWTSSWRP